MNQFTEESLSDVSLQQELENKDNIIAALTEQLEGTADQLDRLKRSGAKETSKDPGSRFPGGIASQVASAIEAFEELAPAEHFERIESGINQILQMLSNGEVQLGFNVESEPEVETSHPKKAGDDDRFWEETRARLLAGNVETEKETLGDSTTNTDEAEDESVESESPTLYKARLDVGPIPEPPKPIEITTDLVLLEEGISERDSYISYLTARLRNAESAHYPPINWSDLTSVPESLIQELVNKRELLEDHLRQSEIAVALERASLTRERSKLFQIKQYLAQEVKRLGGMVDSSEALKEKAPGTESRWGKFFDKAT